MRQLRARGNRRESPGSLPGVQPSASVLYDSSGKLLIADCIKLKRKPPLLIGKGVFSMLKRQLMTLSTYYLSVKNLLIIFFQ